MRGSKSKDNRTVEEAVGREPQSRPLRNGKQDPTITETHSRPDRQTGGFCTWVFGRVLQCRTGHGYIGEYYSSENVDCPCGKPYQTREYIIRECPLYEDQREELREASRSLYLPDIHRELRH